MRAHIKQCTVDRVFFQNLAKFGFQNCQILGIRRYKTMTNSNIHKFRRANAYVHTAKFLQLMCFPTTVVLCLRKHIGGNVLTSIESDFLGQREHIMVWLYFCGLRWVTCKTINQSLNGIRMHLHSNDSLHTERTSDRKALRINELLSKVFSIISEDVNFPAIPL